VLAQFSEDLEKDQNIKDIKFVQNILGRKKLENTDLYTHLTNFESDE
jgi:site-specific recombinase XerC